MSALGAYRDSGAFAYPGWRLTVPGGPAGGHYKGFTHNYSEGTAIGTVADPNDDYELARAKGLAAHDPIHTHPNAPRGVYRSPAEVPPRANASGSAMTYRGFQTRRHAGTSVAPGSFPAPFYETGEDILATMLGYIPAKYDGDYPMPGPAQTKPGSVYTAVPSGTAPAPGYIHYYGPPVLNVKYVPKNGATSTVPQPATPPAVSHMQLPAPAPSVPAATPPGGTMPALAPAPSVPSGIVNQDASGNFVDAFGNVYASSDVSLDPTTNQYRVHPGSTPSTMASVTSWLSSHSIYSAWPNWYFLAGGAGLLLLFGRRRGR